MAMEKQIMASERAVASLSALITEQCLKSGLSLDETATALGVSARLLASQANIQFDADLNSATAYARTCVLKGFTQAAELLMTLESDALNVSRQLPP